MEKQKEIARRMSKWIAKEIDFAMNHREYTSCFHLNRYVSVVLTMVGGYGPEESKTNRFVSSDGYGAEISLRRRDSSYFMDDWDYLCDSWCSLHEETNAAYPFQGICERMIEIAESCIYYTLSLPLKVPGYGTIDIIGKFGDIVVGRHFNGLYDEGGEFLIDVYYRYHEHQWEMNEKEKEETRLLFHEAAEEIASWHDEEENHGFISRIECCLLGVEYVPEMSLSLALA